MSLINDIETMLRDSQSEEQDATARYVERKNKLEEILEISSDLDTEMRTKLEKLIYTFQDILEEEEVHIGQFAEMMNYFGISTEKQEEGSAEAIEDITSSGTGLSGDITFSDLGKEYKKLF